MMYIFILKYGIYISALLSSIWNERIFRTYSGEIQTKFLTDKKQKYRKYSSICSIFDFFPLSLIINIDAQFGHIYLYNLNGMKWIDVCVCRGHWLLKKKRIAHVDNQKMNKQTNTAFIEWTSRITNRLTDRPSNQ